MKRILFGFAMLAAMLPATAADVGVSIGIDQPGVYGRIDIGRVQAPPVLVYQQPMLIAPPPVVIDRRPIYLHVPSGHARNWGKYCGRYAACAQPVYFVQDNWYRDVYAPVYRGDHVHDSKYERKREKEMRKREKEWRKHDKKHDKKHHKKHHGKHDHDD